jgi:hypothetical protein
MKRVIFLLNFFATAAFSAMITNPIPQLQTGAVDVAAVVDVYKMDVKEGQTERVAKGTSFGAALSYGIAENMQAGGKLVYRSVKIGDREYKRGLGFGVALGAIVYEFAEGKVGAGLQVERFTADVKEGTGDVKWMEYQLSCAASFEGLIGEAPITPYFGLYINKVDADTGVDVKEKGMFGMLLGADITPAAYPMQISLQARFLAETSFSCLLSMPLR